MQRAKGLEPSSVTPADFEAVDKLHFRGRAATLELASLMQLTAASKVLDISAGLGGVARALAETADCHATGIGLTPELRAAAAEFSGWLGMSDQTEFVQGGATSLPIANGAFDAAITVIAAMSIPQRPGVCRGAAGFAAGREFCCL